jgi:hypothetical protein
MFFQPPRLRTENTAEIIAHHLRRDPNLTEEAAGHIAGLVRELYTNLARPPEAVRVRLRAAPTFKPDASCLLGELLQDIQHKLTACFPGADDK